MKLIIGGAWQGKTKFAEETFQLSHDRIIDGSSCAEEDIFSAAAITHFEMYIRRFPIEQKEIKNFVQKLTDKAPEIVIITNELGCGIVPMDKEEREWRECNGRLNVELSGNSSEVYRVVCGLGQKLK